eukprot:11735318-Ditylum_brightwellii.AAC.1
MHMVIETGKGKKTSPVLEITEIIHQKKSDLAHIQQLATLLEIEDILSLSPAEIAKNLMAAWKSIRVVQQNAVSIQDMHLEEMAKARLKNSKCNLTAVIKNIKHCEEMKLSF